MWRPTPKHTWPWLVGSGWSTSQWPGCPSTGWCPWQYPQAPARNAVSGEESSPGWLNNIESRETMACYTTSCNPCHGRDMNCNNCKVLPLTGLFTRLLGQASSPTFLGDMPKGPTFGASTDEGACSPPYCLRNTTWQIERSARSWARSGWTVINLNSHPKW